jgi:hypothetical protein
MLSSRNGEHSKTLDDTLDQLFAGRADLYDHFVKHLDSFPPQAKLEAYVRSAEAVMTFVKLAQYQT